MTDTNKPKNPVGWPKGKPRGIGKKHDQRQDEWSWNGDLLLSKMDRKGEDDCWPWLGSTGPMGNLFGGSKSGKAQMTQANRLIHAQFTGESFYNKAVHMRCYDRYCCNPKHFELKDYPRWKDLE